MESPTACRDYISTMMRQDSTTPSLGLCEKPKGDCRLTEPNMKNESTSQIELTAAATVAGEDLACGEYVSLLSETVDFPSFLWDSCGAGLSPHELVRLKVIPANAGHPLKVIAICLPFVYAKMPGGEMATIDTRRTQLVRLNRRCAKVIWKELQSRAKRENPSSRD